MLMISHGKRLRQRYGMPAEGSEKKKLLIIQNLIFHYRKPVYNELAKHYNVTVLHSGEKSVAPNDTYKEIICSSKQIGPLIFQSNVLRSTCLRQYDVVIAMFDLHWVNNILRLVFRSKKYFIWWGHRYSKSGIVNILKDLLILASDGVLLYTGGELSRMARRGISLSKVFVAENTVDVPNHSEGIGSDKDSFIYTGRAQGKKRVDTLIKAFAEVIDRIPDNTMINIIGSGQENIRLKKLAQNLGVHDRVVFYGEIIDPDLLGPLFHRAYAYVSPGHVGLGVLHSFAYGIPVVTDCTRKHAQEFQNLIDGKNALLYKTYDELKEILVTLATDKHLSKMLGKNAYELYSKERTLDKMTQGFRDAIEHAFSIRQGTQV